MPGADVAGGLGGPSNGLDAGNGKDKAVAPVHSDDEVSSYNDHPCKGGGGCFTMRGSPSVGSHQQGSGTQSLLPCRGSTHQWCRHRRQHQVGLVLWMMRQWF
jgi:hypothetical protein